MAFGVERVLRLGIIMRKLFLFFSSLFTTLAANALEPLTNYGVMLMQPENVVQQRIQDVGTLAAYIRAVESATSQAVASTRVKPGSSGFVVVAVRPGQRSNAWLDFKPALPPELASAMLAKVQAVPPPSVAKGPVVFALKVGLWGSPDVAGNVPAPKEWAAATAKAGRAIEVGNLVEMIWHD